MRIRAVGTQRAGATRRSPRHDGLAALDHVGVAWPMGRESYYFDLDVAVVGDVCDVLNVEFDDDIELDGGKSLSKR